MISRSCQNIISRVSYTHLNKTKRQHGFINHAALIAERQGFEPWEQLPVHRISSAARSTTPASFLIEGIAREGTQNIFMLFL